MVDITYQDVVTFVDGLERSYEQTSEAIGTIKRTFSGERCWHGVDVPVANLKDIPDWADVCSGYGGGSYVVENGVRKLGLKTPDQWRNIAALDPIAGIASQGTPFQDLTPQQQRAYFANAAAIAIALNVSDLSGYRPEWDRLSKIMTDMGWQPWTKEFVGERNATARDTGIDPVSGKPMMVTTNDMNAAMARLSAPDIKTISAPGTQFGASTMTATYTQPGVTPTQSDLQGCLQLPYGQRSNCVRDILKANPDLAKLYEATQDPWKEVIDPSKMVQGVYGLNGKHYTVVKLGSKHYATRTMFIAIGLSTSAAATAAAVGATAIFLFGTKRGKKFRKKVFGR